MEHIDTEMYRLDTDRITGQQYSTFKKVRRKYGIVNKEDLLKSLL